MSLLFFLFSTLTFAQSLPTVWTVSSFQAHCSKLPGQIQSSVDPDTKKVRFECKENGVEIRSAWFSNRKASSKMLGKMERNRNSQNLIVLDQNFDSEGALKEETYYLETLSSPKTQSQNLFVFDSNHQLIRANITMGSQTFVVLKLNNEFIVSLNGQTSTMQEFKKALGGKFHVEKNLSEYDQVTQIWRQQNEAQSQTKPGATTK